MTPASPAIQGRRLVLLSVGFVALPIAAACESSQSPPPSFAEGCSLDTTVADCDDCIEFEHVTRLGSEEGEAFLEDNGTLGDIVLDGQGNFWVGQRDQVKIYASTGSLATTIGRSGEGPMEFRFAQPMHRDGQGRVHIFDSDNVRVSMVDDNSLSLVEERRLPASWINAMAPIADGQRYVVSSWIESAERMGMPLHIIDTRGDVIRSFGAGRSPAVQELDPFSARRLVATDSQGRIVSSHWYDYIVEAWTSEGARIGALSGRNLVDAPRLDGAWSAENPPWHRVSDVRFDGEWQLWVLLRYRRPDWLENMEEMVTSSGRVALRAKDGTLSSYYHSRVDVIDLRTCRVLVSNWHDGVLMSFVGDRLLSEIVYGPGGDPRVDIWNVQLR